MRGSANMPTESDLSLNPTFPAIPVWRQFTRLHHSLYAAACGFGRHPGLGKTHITVSRLDTVSGQIQPVCYHTNPPAAYTSKRAIDVTTTFRMPDNRLATSYDVILTALIVAFGPDFKLLSMFSSFATFSNSISNDCLIWHENPLQSAGICCLPIIS